jgi:hypothetical protein
VDAEVVGDELHVQDSEDEQRERDRPDECEHNQDQARESVGREVSWATWLAPARCGRRGRFGGPFGRRRGRFGGHPIEILRRELGRERCDGPSSKSDLARWTTP